MQISWTWKKKPIKILNSNITNTKLMKVWTKRTSIGTKKFQNWPNFHCYFVDNKFMSKLVLDSVCTIRIVIKTKAGFIEEIVVTNCNFDLVIISHLSISFAERTTAQIDQSCEDWRSWNFAERPSGNGDFILTKLIILLRVRSGVFYDGINLILLMEAISFDRSGFKSFKTFTVICHARNIVLQILCLTLY